MQLNEFIQLMQQNRQPTIDLLPKLEQLTTEYPWFSIAYQLRLKVLKAFDDELFASQLPLTAAHTVNRGQLYSYLFVEKPLATGEENTDPIFYYQPDEVDFPVLEREIMVKVKNNEPLTILTEAATDYFVLDEDATTKDTASKNEELLAKFIAANPKIIPRQQEEESSEEIKLACSTKGIASELLAQIYIEQKLYNKALAVYMELSLQNPKKRAYFAALIKKVKDEIK